MSTRFAEHFARSRALGAAALTLIVAACGSSTPRQAEVKPAPALVAPAPAAAEPSRRERRASEKTADDAATAVAPKSADAGRKDRRGRGEEPVDAAGGVEVVPEAASLAYERALGAMREQNWLQAELELEQLTRDFPTYPGPLVNLAIVYKRDGRPDDAAAALDRALAVDPAHAAANTERGITLREQGKFAEAEAAYRRALATDPTHTLAHYNLGVLLDVYLRRPAEALEQYQLYQGAASEPNTNVAKWIVDLKRRVGNNDNAARVANEDGP